MKENEKIKKPSDSMTESQMERVVGGSEPEEFDWRDRYVSPVNKTGGSLWSFSAEANVEGQYFKKIKSGPDANND